VARDSSLVIDDPIVLLIAQDVADENLLAFIEIPPRKSRHRQRLFGQLFRKSMARARQVSQRF